MVAQMGQAQQVIAISAARLPTLSPLGSPYIIPVAVPAPAKTIIVMAMYGISTVIPLPLYGIYLCAAA